VERTTALVGSGARPGRFTRAAGVRFRGAPSLHQLSDASGGGNTPTAGQLLAGLRTDQSSAGSALRRPGHPGTEVPSQGSAATNQVSKTPRFTRVLLQPDVQQDLLPASTAGIIMICRSPLTFFWVIMRRMRTRPAKTSNSRRSSGSRMSVWSCSTGSSCADEQRRHWQPGTRLDRPSRSVTAARTMRTSVPVRSCDPPESTAETRSTMSWEPQWSSYRTS
jgi:hypothetical protein